MEKELFSLTTRQVLPERYSPLVKSELGGSNMIKFLDLLIFVSKVTANSENMYIPPSEIFVSQG